MKSAEKPLLAQTTFLAPTRAQASVKKLLLLLVYFTFAGTSL